MSSTTRSVSVSPITPTSPGVKQLAPVDERMLRLLVLNALEDLVRAQRRQREHRSPAA